MGAEPHDELSPADDDTPTVDTLGVGVVASADNAAAVARCILRAQDHGHTVLVTHRGNPHIEAVGFAEQLGAHVVHPDAADPSSSQLRAAVESAAETLAVDAVVYNDEAEHRIDFAASRRHAEPGAVVDAVVADPATPADATVVVGIPAYNEAATIADVVGAAREVADVVIVVDDGSTDDTVAAARAAGAVVVEHDHNQGYGAALKTIFEAGARRVPEHLVILDGDGQHDPGDIPRLVECQRATDAQIVIGSRFAEDATTDAPLYRRFGLHVINALTNLSLGVVRPATRISDTQSGFRAYDRRAIRAFAAGDSIGDHMSASTDILYQAHHHDFDIAEVGTDVSYDRDDTSTQNPIAHGVTLVSNILRTVEQDRPIPVLGIPGFVLTLVGIGFGYWTFSNYITTGVFPVGLAVTSAFFGLVGVFAAFTAIILHALNTQLPE